MYLFSEVSSTHLFEPGHGAEVGTLEIGCLDFEGWLEAQCGKWCPATVARAALHVAMSVGTVLPAAGSSALWQPLKPHVPMAAAIPKLVSSAWALLSQDQNDCGSGC